MGNLARQLRADPDFKVNLEVQWSEFEEFSGVEFLKSWHFWVWDFPERLTLNPLWAFCT